MLRKLLVIVAGLTMVFAFASVARADFDVTGHYEFRGVSDFDLGTWNVAPQSLELRIKGLGYWGQASADVTFKLSGFADPGKVAADTANFNYKFSDVFSAGVTYKLDKFMLLDDYNVSVNLGGDWLLASDTYLKGALTLKNGGLTVYTSGDMNPFEIAAVGTYTVGPVALSSWFGYTSPITGDDTARFLAKAAWAVNNQFTATGEFLYDYNVTGSMDAAARVDYRPGWISAYARLGYSIDDQTTYYKIYGEVPIITNTIIYGWYQDGNFTGGAKYTFGPDTYLCAEYVGLENNLYLKLVGSF